LPSNDYALAHKARMKKGDVVPPSDGKTLTPSYLLNHQNHFDPNVRTPEEMIQRGVLRGKLDVTDKI